MLLLVCLLACVAPASAAASMKMLIGAAEDEGRNSDPAVARMKMDLAKAAGFNAIRITAIWAPGQTKVDANQLVALQAAAVAGARHASRHRVRIERRKRRTQKEFGNGGAFESSPARRRFKRVEIP